MKMLLSIQREIFIQFMSTVHTMSEYKGQSIFWGKVFQGYLMSVPMIIPYLFIMLEYESDIWKSELL